MSELIIGRTLAELPGVLAQVAKSGSKVMVVADSAVASRYGQGLKNALSRAGFDVSLTRVPSGERSKTLSQARSLYRTLARKKYERKSWLLALGGGVVGDLTGFIAATFLRGLSYAQVPTTLLAQVDASIGGKTGIDIPEGKNLVGSFYHPRLIWITPALLKTLPVRHWRNGLAEVIKYGAIADAALFEQLESKMDVLCQGYSPEWDAIIARCARIKEEIVKKDPTERTGLRALLNFGHTVGHAIEGAMGYRHYLHGEAISIGMWVAGVLSEQMTGLDGQSRIRIGNLLSRAGLPSRVSRKIPRAHLLQYLARDKKSLGGKVGFVLLKEIGKAISGQEVPPEILSVALQSAGL